MRWLRIWGPVVVWAAVIFSFSTGAFDFRTYLRIIVPVLHWLFPRWSPETLDGVHYLIRKSGHFTEYFVFSLLVLRAFRYGQKGMRLVWALGAIGAAAVYAGLDEFHQSFVPGRTAAFTDVLLDTAGSVAAQVVAALVMLLGDVRRKRKENFKAAGVASPDPD